MTGAWIVQVRYTGPTYAATYPHAFPQGLRRKVLHDPKLDQLVDCPVIGMDQSANVPGAFWDPYYAWPPPPTSEVVEAPVGDKQQFIAAATQLLDKIPFVIVQHIRCHDATDEVTKLYLELITLLDGINE